MVRGMALHRFSGVGVLFGGLILAACRVVRALPSVYRRLVRPDFGSATLLGTGPLIFVSDAGQGDRWRSQRRRELEASFTIEERLCRLSSDECPGV